MLQQERKVNTDAPVVALDGLAKLGAKPSNPNVSSDGASGLSCKRLKKAN
jgi:hypothetical protein